MFKVYLDQSAASHLIEPDLSFSDMYATLNNLQEDGAIEIWASPHNVIELVVWGDLDKRQRLSQALENLTQGRRMLASYEFILLYEALTAIERVWPGCKANFKLFFDRSKDNQRIYSGLLAHLAALKTYDARQGSADIIRTKKLSKLRQLKLLINPKASFNILVDDPSSAPEIEKAFDKDYADASIEQLVNEIAKLEEQLKDLGRQKAAAQKFEKHRTVIADNFTANFVLPAIAVTIKGLEDLLSLLDYQFIVSHWSTVPTDLAPMLDARSLYPDVSDRFATNKQTVLDFETVCDECLKRVVPIMFMPHLMMDFLLKELEKAFKTAVAPTEGLTIDVDHISALYCCDVFLTYDNKLASSLGTWFRNCGVAIEPKRHILGHLNELKRLVQDRKTCDI